MRNIESVARSFEKTADELDKIPTSHPQIGEIAPLRADLRMRATGVRTGQRDLDRAKELLAALKERAR